RRAPSASGSAGRSRRAGGGRDRGRGARGARGRGLMRRKARGSNTPPAPPAAAETGAAGIGQHEVEDDGVEGLALQQRLPLAGGAGDGQTKARPAEIGGDHSGDAAVLSDDP